MDYIFITLISIITLNVITLDLFIFIMFHKFKNTLKGGNLINDIFTRFGEL